MCTVVCVCQERYNGSGAAAANSKIEKVKGEMNAVKDVMIKNIDKVLDNSERIELLVEKSDDLDHRAFTFKKHATQLKNSMWWKNVKLMCLVATIVLVIFFIILIAACGGFSFSKCK